MSTAPTIPVSVHKVSSEWMETHVQKAPQTQQFVSVDLPRGAVIVFIDEGGKLLLLQPGRKEGLFDLGVALSLGSAAIAVDAALSPDGKLLYLAIAVTDRVLLIGGVGEEDLCVAEKWAACYSSTGPIGQSFAVRIGGLVNDFPTAILQTRATPDVSVQIARISKRQNGDTDTASDKLETTWLTLPYLPDAGSTVLSSAGILKRSGTGTFLTYHCSGKRMLTFVPDKADSYGLYQFRSLQPPEDVVSLCVIHRTDGYTDLLAGGAQGLFRYTVDQWDHPERNSLHGTLVLNGRISHVHPAIGPVHTRADVWAVVNETELGYLRVVSTEIVGQVVQAGKWTPVRSGPYKRIRPSVSADTTVRRLCTVSEGHMVMLERSSTGIWSEQNVTIPLSESPIVTSAYVTTLRFFGRQAINKVVRLTSTGSATYVINSLPVAVDSAGVDVTTDSSGTIHIVNASTEVTTPQLAFQEYGYTSAGDLLAERQIDRSSLSSMVAIDVSGNVRANLHDMPTDPAKLRQLTTKVPGSNARQPLFDDSTDFKALGDNLSVLQTHSASLPADGSLIDLPPDEDRDQLPWDHAHFFSSLASVTKRFFIKAGHLIIEIAGKIKAFAIQCIEHALKAFHYVLEACGAAWDKLVGYLGWVFNWEDIMVTKRNIQALGVYGLDFAAESIDHVFDKIENSLASMGARPLPVHTEPDEAKNLHGDSRDQVQTDDATAGTETKHDHPAIDYIISHISSIFTSTITAVVGGDDARLAKIQQIIVDNTHILTAAEDIFSSIRATIDEIASKELHSLHDLMSTLASSPLVTTVLTLVRNLVHNIIRPIAAELFALIKEGMTSEIRIPFFSALYKFATGEDKDFKLPSMLEIIAFILAIPTTILLKLATSANPLEVQTIDPKELHEMSVTESTSTVKRNNSIASAAIWYFNIPDAKDTAGAAQRAQYIACQATQPFLVATIDHVQNALNVVKGFDAAEIFRHTKIFAKFAVPLKFLAAVANLPLATQSDLGSTSVIWLRQAFYLAECVSETATILGMVIPLIEGFSEKLARVIGILLFPFFQGGFAIADIVGDTVTGYTSAQAARERALEGLRFPEIIVTVISRALFAKVDDMTLVDDPKKRAILVAAGAIAGESSVIIGVARGGLMCSLPNYGLTSL